MGKYQVGQEVVLKCIIDNVDCTDTKPFKVKYGPGYNEFDFVSEAVLDASNPQPAPVAQDWQPKVGERVMLEVTVRGEPDEQGEVPITFDSVTGRGSYHWFCARSAIVGPAPVRARFAVGDEVFIESAMLAGKISGRITDQSWYVKVRTEEIGVMDCDLLTLSEARERLAK